MQTLKIIKDGKYKKGQVVIVENNAAHALIDKGEAELVKNYTYRTKVMVSDVS